jgi:DNA helicase-2/ATP-dependent DNA helicase PcrA
MSAPDLNPPQAEAALHTEGPLLVFAGAGSGKTRVITYRIANLIAREGVVPYRILAVTFTNRAAKEMRERLGRLLGDSIARDIWAGTFHSTCAKLLRQYGESVGLSKSFVIYDSQDQKSLLTRILKERNYDDKRFVPRQVLAWIHKQKQEAKTPEEAGDGYPLDQSYRELYALYEKQLRACNAVDFEDLILRVSQILSDPRNPDGDRIRSRFDHVLIDEFQDTNAVQYKLMRSLVDRHHNLCVVGDDDQSIYSWRGADVRNIRGFQRDFPNAKVVKLEQNYRSSSNIVGAALAVIAPSSTREPKELWTANEAGEPIEVIGLQTEREEAALIVSYAKQARDAGIDLNEVAVFYRINAQSRVLEEALRGANLPYQVVGGMKFFERAEVKDALAYLRVIDNPQSDMDLLRIINTPARGIGDSTIGKLTTHAAFCGLSLTEALSHAESIGELSSGPRKKLSAFGKVLVDLRSRASELPPSALLREVLDASGYNASLRAENSAEADSRIENLQELYGSLRDFEAEAEAAGEAPSLAGFLERVSLVNDVDTMDDAARVTLMTVHSAKGLEFNLVMLTGMEEEMFPYRGFDGRNDDELEEERRLAYVAITRARQRLVITHVQRRQIFGTTRMGVPSRFIGNLPHEAVVHRATSAPLPRYVDQASYGGYSASRPNRSHPWAMRTHVVTPQPAADPGERFVDRDFFDEGPTEVDEAPSLQPGSQVQHARFGRGQVRAVASGHEPVVTAFFPGWGEKKVLVRFLTSG